MNDNLYKKAQEKAFKFTQDMAKEERLPKPQSLEQIRKSRLSDRELEKDAPKTGYPELDRIIKGFVPGHLYTVTGVENVGKTSIATNFAVRVAFQMKRVLYLALEPDNMVIEYIASVFHDKRFDDLTDDDLLLDGLPIDTLDKTQVPDLKKLVEVIEMGESYDLVIVDHIGYFITSENNPIQQQSNTVKTLAGLARKRKCAILLIAHLRKRSKGERKDYVPTNDDISGSGAFKQDSTEVMIVTRNLKSDEPDEFQYANFGKLYVTKTKMGSNGSVGLNFSERKANILSDEEQLERSRHEESRREKSILE